MEFIIGWSLGGIILCVMFYIITIFHRKCVERQNARAAEKNAEDRRYKEQRQQEYLQLITFNREHMPSTELPPLDPDWAAVDELVAVTYFGLMDEGDRYRYLDVSDHSKPKFILKSDFDDDTLKLIELLNKDVKWFYKNPTGEKLWEQAETLKNFLREKYSGLSEKSISRICSTYCINNR